MDEFIDKLEQYEETQEIDVKQLLKEYKQRYRERPIWQMIEDIQRGGKLRLSPTPAKE